MMKKYSTNFQYLLLLLVAALAVPPHYAAVEGSSSGQCVGTAEPCRDQFQQDTCTVSLSWGTEECDNLRESCRLSGCGEAGCSCDMDFEKFCDGYCTNTMSCTGTPDSCEDIEDKIDCNEVIGCSWHENDESEDDDQPGGEDYPTEPPSKCSDEAADMAGCSGSIDAAKACGECMFSYMVPYEFDSCSDLKDAACTGLKNCESECSQECHSSAISFLGCLEDCLLTPSCDTSPGAETETTSDTDTDSGSTAGNFQCPLSFSSPILLGLSGGTFHGESASAAGEQAQWSDKSLTAGFSGKVGKATGMCTVVEEADASGKLHYLCTETFSFSDGSTLVSQGTWHGTPTTGNGDYTIIGGTGCFSGVSGKVVETTTESTIYIEKS